MHIVFTVTSVDHLLEEKYSSQNIKVIGLNLEKLEFLEWLPANLNDINYQYYSI